MRDIVMVVGSGMMGSGIGAMSALAGNKTVLVDTSELNFDQSFEAPNAPRMAARRPLSASACARRTS